MLSDIENRYGQRDKSWTFVGVEFEQNGPQCWFPGNCNNIAIQLSLCAMDDEIKANYQLAHEAVHLLAPDGKRGAPVIEEGLATVYSEDYVLEKYQRSEMTSMQSYQNAAETVRELLEIDSASIKKLRRVEPSFKKMCRETFVRSDIVVHDALIERLIQKFNRE